MKKKILIIAGEASGDQHAADLVRELQACRKNLEFVGIGGERMQAAGVRLYYHISQLAMIGIVEVIRHLPLIRKVTQTIKAVLKQGTEAVILVDYPGFNLRVARIAKSMNIPVIYYISPQLWAWREKRVEKIRRFVDLLLVIFKFEEEFYKTHGITAHFVGHPLAEQIRIEQRESEFRQANQLAGPNPILGLFPGSREMEVKNLLPVMLQAALNLQRKINCIPVIGAAAHLPRDLYCRLISGYPGIKLLENQTYLLMRYAHAAMVASGTATLELGYLQTPMVVLYTVSPITYWLGKRLVKIPNIALANIVLGDAVVPELLQHQSTAENLTAAVQRYFSDASYYRAVKIQLGGIREILGEEGASRRAAARILAFFDQERQISPPES